MTDREHHSEVVEAEGHLIDSQLLNQIFDAVIKNGASFEVLHFEIGRTNEEPSAIAMRVTSAHAAALKRVLEELVTLGCRLAREQDARLCPTDRDGCVPDDFYSTTNHRTLVRYGGRWLEVAEQRMDAVIVLEAGRAVCRKLRDVRSDDAIVCGVEGVRVVPEFRERDRLGFAFMTTEISSGRRVDVTVARIAAMMRDVKLGGGRVAMVVGPVAIHTGGPGHFTNLIRSGYVDVLLAGNALAVHDVEQALSGTSHGVDLEPGKAIDSGHPHHTRAIK